MAKSSITKLTQKQSREEGMNLITNEKRDKLSYGDSPHIIVVTADSHITQTVEPSTADQHSDYLPDNKTEGGTLFPQK